MAPVTIVKSETDTSLDQAYLAFGTFVGTTNVTAAAGPPELRPVQNSPCCPWPPDRDRVPAQRRHLPRDVHASAPGDHSCLRRSAARYRFGSPRRFAA